MSALSDEIRMIFEKGDTIRDAGLATPEDIKRYDDIPYGNDETLQKLDLYRPKHAEDALLPVIINVHGGGWVYGDKERYQFYCMDLAQRGFAVINFTYRLAPEFKYPAQLEDLNLVCEWLMRNAEDYRLDLSRLFAIGDSAGAHLLGLYICICINKEYAKQYAFSVPKGIAFRAVALNCGAYRIDMCDREDLTTMLMHDFLPEKGTTEEIEKICVLSHITEQFPPVYMMTAVDDFLKMQAPLLAEKLSEQNIPFVYRLYGNQENRLAHVFHLDIRLEEAKNCNSDECDFFKSFIIK